MYPWPVWHQTQVSHFSSDNQSNGAGTLPSITFRPGRVGRVPVRLSQYDGS